MFCINFIAADLIISTKRLLNEYSLKGPLKIGLQCCYLCEELIAVKQDTDWLLNTVAESCGNSFWNILDGFRADSILFDWDSNTHSWDQPGCILDSPCGLDFCCDCEYLVFYWAFYITFLLKYWYFAKTNPTNFKITFYFVTSTHLIEVYTMILVM